jgi:broad specificity phosphatase PhoE
VRRAAVVAGGPVPGGHHAAVRAANLLDGSGCLRGYRHNPCFFGLGLPLSQRDVAVVRAVLSMPFWSSHKGLLWGRTDVSVAIDHDKQTITYKTKKSNRCYNQNNMDTLRVHLIRHASGTHMLTPELIMGRCVDAELTEIGEWEAALKGWELAQRGISPDHVASSSARRCIQTGEIALRTMGVGLPIHGTNELLEMDHGDYVGRRKDESYTDETQAIIREQGKDFAWPGGESMNNVAARGLGWLRSLENYPRPSTIITFGHGVLFSCMVSELVDWDQLTTLAAIRSMPPVGETRLSFDGHDWRVEAFAEPVQI